MVEKRSETGPENGRLPQRNIATTLWTKTALLPSGWAENVRVAITTDGLIANLETGVEPDGADHRTGPLLPAPANAHSHAFQRAMAGLTERRGPNASDSFWTWRELMYRFLDRLTPSHVEAIAALVQMEMLEAGYAANVEFHYLHHQPGGAPYDNLAEMAERIAAAAVQTGIGLTLLPVHYQFGGCDGRPLGAEQGRFFNDFDRFARLHEASAAAVRQLPADCKTGVSAHSLRAVARADLGRLKVLAATNPFHMHLAEQDREVEEVQAAYGARPVEWVLDQFDADQTCCFIHCTKMLPHETTGLAETGAVAGLCPITEANLGDGIFDGVRWLDAGGRIAIGSDSNVRIGLSEELRLLEYTQRLRDSSRAALASAEKSTGRRIFEETCTGGAITSGRGSGVIAVDNPADLIALDGDAVDVESRGGDTLLDTFVFAAGDKLITDVWSAGRHMVAEGRHRRRADIIAAYRDTIRDLGEAL